MSVAFAPSVAIIDRGLVAFGFGHSLVLADLQGNVIAETNLLSGKIVALAWDGAAHVYSLTESKILQRWTLDGLKLDESLLISRRALGLIVGDDGCIAIGDKFGNIQRWSMEELRSNSENLTRGILTHLAEAPADTIFENCYKPLLPLLKEVSTEDDRGEEPDELEARAPAILGHLASITNMRKTVDGLLVSADRDEKIMVAEYPSLHSVVAILVGHTEFVVDVSVGQKGFVHSVAADRTVRRWDIKLAEEVANVELVQVTKPVGIQASDSGRKVMVFGDSAVEVFDAESLKLLQTIALPEAIIGILNPIEAPVWLSVSGNIYRGLEVVGKIGDGSGSGPAEVDHWKHDRKNPLA